jgi:hypothetical protein
MGVMAQFWLKEQKKAKRDIDTEAENRYILRV